MPINRFLKKAREIEQDLQSNKGKKPKIELRHDDGNWLVSYADMMTLLCVFFIMLFSMARLNAPEYERIRVEMAKQYNQDAEIPTDDMAKFVTQVLQEAGLEKKVMIESDPLGVSVIFHSTVFFDTLSSEVNETGHEILNKLIGAIAERQKHDSREYKVVVEGHTDSRPIVGGDFPSNWELSSARASRVLRMFLDAGFSPLKLLAIGYGDTRPKVANRTPTGDWNEEGLAKNRRVVIRILQPIVDSIPWEESPQPPANTAH